MKKKPVLITLGIVVVLAIGFFFVRGRFLSRPEKNDVLIFLNAFNNQVKAGNSDSVRTYFEINQKPAVLNRLISVLTNKTGLKGDQTPLFKLALYIDYTKVRVVNNELAEAKIPVYFTNDTLGSRESLLILKVRKLSSHNYKIVQVNANKMMADYLAFDNFIKSKTLTDKDIYSESTLKAFETAMAASSMASRLRSKRSVDLTSARCIGRSPPHWRLFAHARERLTSVTPRQLEANG